MEVLMTTNGAYDELQGMTNRGNQARNKEQQRTEKTNGRERKRRMAGNGNDEQQGMEMTSVLRSSPVRFFDQI
jgi:hypothetical protein